MKTRYLLAFAVAALIVIPAYAKVSTDFDPSANFSQYHTYAWGEGTPARNPLIAQRIVHARHYPRRDRSERLSHLRRDVTSSEANPHAADSSE